MSTPLDDEDDVLAQAQHPTVPTAPTPPPAAVGTSVRPPSIADVARLAGVSAQTVSRVSTGADNVRPSTRAKVLEAIAEIGYAPNVAARALRNGSFGVIGLIAHQLSRTGEARTIERVVESARIAGYTVNLVDVERAGDSDVEAAVTRLAHQSIDGLVIIRAENETPADLKIPDSLPVVVSDSRFIGHHAMVGCDQVGGTHDAVTHLLDLGHRTVHHISGPETSAPALMRADGWRDSLIAAGREVPVRFEGDWTARSGYEIGQRIAQDPEVTAVYCANDEMAAGLMLALHQAGRRVPQDISVVGFDNILLSEYFTAPLTTVFQDFAAIGSNLLDLLMRQIREKNRLSDVHVIVPAPLIVRASTAPPAAL